MKKILLAAGLLLAANLGLCAQDRLYRNEFPIGDVTLLDGPFSRIACLLIPVPSFFTTCAVPCGKSIRG